MLHYWANNPKIRARSQVARDTLPEKGGLEKLMARECGCECPSDERA
jgi:hypothetical protein